MNLMINSIDAMKAVDGPRQLTLGTRNDSGEELLVWVADTGIGLPANQAGQIFDAFFTTKQHGTGMGLRISRTIIEAHGGRLGPRTTILAEQISISRWLFPRALGLPERPNPN